jgi:small-conductance mechanosensitive channel/CRP-like cAMP-binding protein
MRRALPEIPSLDPANSHFLGVAVAAGLIVALGLLLPTSGRHLLRQPLWLLGIYFATRLLLQLVPAETVLAHSLALICVVLLLASIGRSGVLLVFDIVLGRRQTRPLPRIVRDITQGVVNLAVLLLALRTAGVEPSSLLTTSAVITAAIALSLQETLSHMVAGLAIQIQRPFDVGDWIQFDGDQKRIGRVVEINWRATKVLTHDEVEVIVPNSTLAKAPITNFTKPTLTSRRSLFFHVPPDVPPHLVQDAILGALGGSFGVLSHPEPSVVNNGIVEGNIEYWVRFFTDNFDRRDRIDGAARDRIWYAFSRANIPLASPNRFVHLHDLSKSKSTRLHKEAGRAAQRMEALRRVDFLRTLSDEILDKLATASQRHIYGQGETIVAQGDKSTEMFIVESGEVSIQVGQPTPQEVARVGAGAFFGEMALMTGEARTATVVSAKPSTLIGVDNHAMRGALEAVPDLAKHVSLVLAERQAERANRAAEAAEQQRTSVEERSSVLLDRIKRFFAL